MRESIARLSRSGMPREIAVCVCRTFARRGDWQGLEEYVYSVEEETKERDDDEW